MIIGYCLLVIDCLLVIEFNSYGLLVIGVCLQGNWLLVIEFNSYSLLVIELF